MQCLHCAALFLPGESIILLADVEKFALCGVQKVRPLKKHLTFLSNVVAYLCRHSHDEDRHHGHQLGELYGEIDARSSDRLRAVPPKE